MILSKFELFNAFANGLPYKPIGGFVINAIERESGCNTSYNVSFKDSSGMNCIIYLKVS